jgi:dipeptidyl aminopeptidase/acylaminoacyl peptidase
MPLPRIGTAEEPMSSLPVGVLPAVDKAIALGFADSERLFVGGLSYGGYTTYGLITQTQRFKAALSMAGPADLISNYGTLDPGRRYAADAHLPHREGIWIPAWAESGQGAMGAPPWRDVARYVRNSPLFSVDRVQTPLMMVYGDLDMVPMQQGEEFFTGLYRQGKRAQLVFYWGEGHSVTTPANVRDLWSRIYAWLDEFGDIARDRDGAVLWDGDRVRSRHGAPALKPEEFLRFERMFAPAPPAVGPASAAAQSR